MKKILYTLVLLIPLTVFAQIITEKDIRIEDFGSKKLKEAPKKVYFREFSIGYQTIIEANTTGNDRKASTKISMTAGLDSKLTEADIQQITDKAYEKAVARLNAAGFTIISHEEAKKIDEYQKRVNILVGGKVSFANGYVYTQPTGNEYYDVTSGVNEATKDVQAGVAKQSKLLGSLSATTKLFDKGTIFDNVGKISDQLGNVPVIDFGMNISFANIVEDRKAGGASTLMGEFGLGAYPYKSAISWKGNGKLGNLETSIKLSPKNYKPFEIEGVIPREKIKKRAEGDYRTDWGTGLVYAQRKDITITNPVKADSELYKAKVAQAVDEYLDILIAQLTNNAK